MIPEGWKRKSLGEIADINSGSTPLRQKDEYWNGTIPWVTTGEIDYQIIESTKEKITELAYKECSLNIHPPGTILMAMYGQGITRGRIAILGINATTNQACCAIRLDSSADTKFIYFQLEHLYPEIRKLGHGGNQQNLNGQIIKQISILFPPLREQRKIAEIISTWDKAIALLEQLITAKRKLKQGLMQQLLTGKKRFKEFEGSEWNLYRIQNIINAFQNGYAFKASGYVEFGIPIISMANISLEGKFVFSKTKVNYWPESELDKLSGFLINKGDLLIAMTDVTPTKNLIGRMAIVDIEELLFLNQRVGLIKVNEKNVNAYFLMYLSNHKNWRKYAKEVSTAGVQANLSTQDIKKAIINLPSLPEQLKIVSILSTADTEISNLEKQLAAYKQQKRGLMQQLLTGKKRVKLNDPQMQKV